MRSCCTRIASMFIKCEKTQRERESREEEREPHKKQIKYSRGCAIGYPKNNFCLKLIQYMIAGCNCSRIDRKTIQLIFIHCEKEGKKLLL